MIDDFAQEFWRKRADTTAGSIRWTDRRMLDLDVEVVGSVTRQGATLIDLGCGTGDVFLALLPRLARVMAVDMIPDFLKRIPVDERITTVVSALGDLRVTEVFDVGIMFGVVTHLSIEQEAAAYATLAAAVPSGVVVVKNQCGRDEDLDVDRWSEAFGSRYVGRYPQVQRQAERLRAVFGDVVVLPYPDGVNPWPDTQHVAFVCRPSAGSEEVA